MAAPAEPPAVPMFAPRSPFTVDLLFELPDSDLRYEVLEGQLWCTR
jgi:hypothetical protein